jgi:GNAT superfamily N-acetyltransferase
MWMHESGYELSSDHSRLDIPLVTEWLAETYWAKGRPLMVVKRSIDNSASYGLYAPDGTQAGFFRVVTDRATFGWLCDVFLAPEHRGKGLALWALQHVRDDILATGVYRILLATSDAHAIYEKLGFTPHAEPEKWMELTTRKIEPS